MRRQVISSVSIAALGVFAGSACGQIAPVGPFTGQMSENLDTIPYQSFPRTIVGFFNSTVTANAIGGSQGLSITGGWGFFCGINPRTGNRLFGATGQVVVEWVFDTPVRRWGAYLGTNADAPDAEIQFFDANGALLGTQIAAVPLCGIWTWNGYESTGAPIKSITVRALHQFGGHIMHDDMELDIGPAACYADCDTTTGVGVLDIFDFLCFGNRFSAGDPYACDCDTTTGPGVCDIFDFLCFGNAFNAGCP